MTISPETIRTVIEIVPDWTLTGNDLSVHRPTSGIMYNEYGFDFDTIGQFELDALAAAAVSVIDNMQNCRFEVFVNGADTTIYEGVGKEKIVAQKFGKNRTENTLNAIAEWVRSGGFESE